MNASASPQPLRGISVLDFTHYLAGPTCTRILADLGAEVIKIEPLHGEEARHVLQVNGYGAMFAFTCAGKKSVCVDLKAPEGLALATELIAKVDVAVENFAPGTMARLGLGFERLQAINPSLIVASVSGFGQFGPMSHHTSFDIIGQAMSGVMDMTGEPDGPPQYVGNYIGDPNTGIHAALGVCAALFERSQTGEGKHIDVSQVEALLYLDMCNVAKYSLSAGQEQPTRFGAHHYAVAPLGVFKARRGYIVIQAMEHQFPKLAEAMGQPELTEDPRFAHNAARLEHAKALAVVIERWLQTFDDDEEPLSRLAEARIPSAPVLSVGQAFNHPHIRARGMVKQVTHPTFGPMEITNTPFFMSGRPTEAQGPAPLLGEHNYTVLTEQLGYSAERIERLTELGVLSEEPAVAELRARPPRPTN